MMSKKQRMTHAKINAANVLGSLDGMPHNANNSYIYQGDKFNRMNRKQPVKIWSKEEVAKLNEERNKTKE